MDTGPQVPNHVVTQAHLDFGVLVLLRGKTS